MLHCGRHVSMILTMKQLSGIVRRDKLKMKQDFFHGSFDVQCLEPWH